VATLPLTGNVGTDSIVRPVASFLEDGSWKIPPAARLTNLGSEPRSFLAKFTITPGDWSSTRTVLGLRPGDAYRRTVEFGPFDLDAAGANLYTAKCSTMLAGDDNGNNTKSAIFQGCDFIDFFDLGSGNLTATGAWALDTPQRPTWTRPPMDSTVWGDGIYGSYGDGENSYLTSPTYKASQDTPAIAFQHNFITQASHDGGNFSYYSTKTGSTWIVLSTCAGLGYTDTVKALHPDSGWTGNSSGWYQSVFKIPVKKDTTFQVRWHFASDAQNHYKGWLIDEVAGINCAWVPPPPRSGRGSMIDTVSVHPTLAHGPALVSYTLVKDCKVAINLYDASGRLAARVPTSGFKKGKNTAKLDASGLARGVYFVKVEGASNTKTTKVIIE
jgi:hypothetical protein